MFGKHTWYPRVGELGEILAHDVVLDVDDVRLPLPDQGANSGRVGVTCPVTNPHRSAADKCDEQTRPTDPAVGTRGSSPRSLNLFDKVATPPQALIDRVFTGAPEI